MPRGLGVGCAPVGVEIDLETRHGPFRGTLELESVAAYAIATNDTSAAVVAGSAVPATYPVVLVFDALNAAIGGLPDILYETSSSGVHGEHDIVLHRALVPGEPLTTRSRLDAVRNTSVGVRVVVRIEQYDTHDELVVEHWWTILFFGSDALADVGSEPPDHTFSEAARAALVGTVTQHIDPDTATRYAEVSNDWSAHHFDLEAARQSGFDYLFAHGLCIMGMCTQAAVGLIADGDPARVRRIAVRFASPTPLDEDLRVDVYAVGDAAYAFEATCAGGTVIKHGLVELVS